RRAKKTAAKASPKTKSARADDEHPAQHAAHAEAAADHSHGDGKEHDKKQEAFDLVLETLEALTAERGDDEKVWSSMVKQALKRRRPGFNERYYGFRSFNGMLEEAEQRGNLKLERDEKSGNCRIQLASNGD